LGLEEKGERQTKNNIWHACAKLLSLIRSDPTWGWRKVNDQMAGRSAAGEGVEKRGRIEEKEMGGKGGNGWLLKSKPRPNLKRSLTEKKEKESCGIGSGDCLTRGKRGS